MLGLLIVTLATTAVSLASGKEVIAWIVAVELFALLVALLVYRSESRPAPRHRVK